MNPTEIEFAVRALVGESFDPATFVFDLIALYNTPRVTVSKLKSGQTNATKTPGDLLWKKRLYFRSVIPGDDVAAVADEMLLDPLTVKHNPRFVFVTDGDQIHIRDRQLDDTCNTTLSRLDESSDFLLPLAGFERRAIATENPADVRAAKRLSKLYDAILASNPTWSDGNHTHELNLFMTRILFCFYAEDTGIFNIPQLFTDTVSQHTSESGSDVGPLLERLFVAMNQREEDRAAAVSAIDNRFPYVNGSLFETTLPIPTFSRTARRLFIECGELDWRTINPDIFGSMIQTIAQPGSRSEVGMHYTSVPNIMKVLQPLLLDDLNDAYEKSKDSVPKLGALLTRLANIRVFDPACGCGNFLVIAYKELRELEMRVLRRLGDLTPNNPLRLSGIMLHNFFGIDVIDFACETAKLSLWIAEYQRNSEFKELFGTARPPLPLGKITTIHNRNALRTDWLNVCPKDDAAETYVCGNPPYQGSQTQSAEQKEDVQLLFSGLTPMRLNIDYVACFFLKASQYIAATSATAAFVSTNSVCQGEQVSILWPIIFTLNIDIAFAYPTFKWQNSAANNAWVACIIVGLSPSQVKRQKYLYINEHKLNVVVIGPYLVPGTKLIVEKAARPLNGLPEVIWGSLPMDGGNLILSPREKDDLLASHPEARRFIRGYVGSEDFINSIERYCLWISDEYLAAALAIPEIKRRIEAVRALRSGSTAKTTVQYGKLPHRFRPNRFMHLQDIGTQALIIPDVSSARRHYLQIGIISESYIASNTLFVVYSPPSYLLAMLSSRLLRIWTETIGGSMRHHRRYSGTLVHNTFPVPTLSTDQKRVLSEHSRAILRARARHPGKNIAWLYNPETMPANLQEAHDALDAYLEEFLYGRRFRDDTHRLEHLFSMYSRMKEIASVPMLMPNISGGQA